MCCHHWSTGWIKLFGSLWMITSWIQAIFMEPAIKILHFLVFTEVHVLKWWDVCFVLGTVTSLRNVAITMEDYYWCDWFTGYSHSFKPQEFFDLSSCKPTGTKIQFLDCHWRYSLLLKWRIISLIIFVGK